MERAAISSMDDPVRLLTNLANMKDLRVSNAVITEDERERERSNSSLRCLLGLKDLARESIAGGEETGTPKFSFDHSAESREPAFLSICIESWVTVGPGLNGEPDTIRF